MHLERGPVLMPPCLSLLLHAPPPVPPPALLIMFLVFTGQEGAFRETE